MARNIVKSTVWIERQIEALKHSDLMIQTHTSRMVKVESCGGGYAVCGLNIEHLRTLLAQIQREVAQVHLESDKDA